MDAPMWYHAPKLVLWCIFEALALALAIWNTRESRRIVRCLCCCDLLLPCRSSAVSSFASEWALQLKECYVL